MPAGGPAFSIGMQKQERYASVIVDISAGALDRPFTYRIPAELSDKIVLGSLVEIPFGRANRKVTGFVVGFCDTCDYPAEKIKAILGIGRKGTDETGEKAVELAAWMRERYGSTMSTALKTVLTARKEKKPVETKEIRLVLSREQALEKLDFYQRKHQVARERLLQALIDVPAQPYTLVTGKLHVPARTIAAMQAQGVLEVKTETSLRNPVSLGEVAKKDLALSPEQENVVEEIFRDFTGLQAGDPDAKRISLLHGITGSGKTEVYIRIIEKIVASGRQAIMLIPEISLTYQTLLRFYRHFGDRVSVMNSTLSEGEKSDQFERARRGEIDVIIGPRSALFTPFPHIGIIVIDEEHEESYKNEHMPKYHARDIAAQIAKMHQAVVVLGSATPSLESMYRAESGEYRYYTLTRRLTGGTLPSVQIVDMREELKMGNDLSLSYPLRQAIHDTAAAGKQTILLLNRRGNSRALVCVDCRQAPECPRCSVRMTYHSANNRLMCHYCGFSQPVPDRCPACGGALKTIGTGTQKVQQELSQLFPDLETIRMDADTVSAANTHEAILNRFQQQKQGVLLGTQMVAKGLNLPDVTLVGVLDADLSLYTGGFRAGETTFNMLTQVVGRAGRGETAGRAVIQTLVPKHEVIRLAARQDYDAFYALEIQLRRVQNAPPFGDMVLITFQGQEEDRVLLGAARFRDSLMACRQEPAYAAEHWTCLGPAPCPVPKVNYHYRYRLTVSCRLTRNLRQLLAYLLKSFGADRQMRGVTAFIDVNGFE